MRSLFRLLIPTPCLVVNEQVAPGQTAIDDDVGFPKASLVTALGLTGLAIGCAGAGAFDAGDDLLLEDEEAPL